MWYLELLYIFINQKCYAKYIKDLNRCYFGFTKYDYVLLLLLLLLRNVYFFTQIHCPLVPHCPLIPTFMSVPNNLFTLDLQLLQLHSRKKVPISIWKNFRVFDKAWMSLSIGPSMNRRLIFVVLFLHDSNTFICLLHIKVLCGIRSSMSHARIGNEC